MPGENSVDKSEIVDHRSWPQQLQEPLHVHLAGGNGPAETWIFLPFILGAPKGISVCQEYSLCCHEPVDINIFFRHQKKMETPSGVVQGNVVTAGCRSSVGHH